MRIGSRAKMHLLLIYVAVMTLVGIHNVAREIRLALTYAFVEAYNSILSQIPIISKELKLVTLSKCYEYLSPVCESKLRKFVLLKQSKLS